MAREVPALQNFIAVEDGEEDGTPRGEQYHHTNQCGGWMEVTDDAAYIRDADKL